MELQTEVLIVGAGPAGVVSALTAKKFNLNYILIERDGYPRDKICGDGVLLKDVSKILNKVDVDIYDFIKVESHYQPSHFLLTDGASVKIETQIDTVIVKRKEFDNYLWKLVNQKENEALKFDKVKIKNIIKSENGYKVYCLKNDEHYTIHAKYIIGADGYSSYIRRNLFDNLKFSKRVASRFYMNIDDNRELQTAMYFEKDISPGYFWCFKINESTYNTGVYLPEESSSNVYNLHNYYLKKYFEKEIPKDDFNTWPIPYNVCFDNLVNNNVLLAGDAAGLCDKMFGHGIDNAITSGYLAVLSIKDSLRQDLNYELKEIYAYNLNNYMGDSLRKSVKAYDELEKNPRDFLNVINQYV